MKIAVCIKQVPDTETKIKLINQDGQQKLDMRNIKWIINPYDEYSIEEALQIKSKTAQETLIKVICLGPKSRISEALRTALAMGIDEAVCIDTADHEGLMESLIVAKLLAQCLKKTGPFDLIFMGKVAIDDNQSAVGPMVAALLNIPHTSVISKLDYQDKKIIVERDIDAGAKEIIEMQLPALVGANKGLNTPRYATLPGIMKAKKKPITYISPTDLGVDLTTSSMEYTDFQLPSERPNVCMMKGEVTEQVTELVKLLKYKEKIF